MTEPIDATAAIKTLREAAELNLDDPLRKGSLLLFPDYGQLVVTGDLHGHRRNFEKLVKFCGLQSAPTRSVILQEIIHDDIERADQIDASHELLLDAARWKCEFPDQVFFLQSNHEVSQVTGHGIMKGGHSVLEGFVAGVEAAYGPEKTPDVLEAINTLILSYPLAARTEHRLFISHSLPGKREIDEFDPSILNRKATLEDLGEGPAAKFLWGRRHPPANIERLVEMLDADLFIMGHQPEPEGFRTEGQRVLILASDHNHGVFLPIDLAKPVTMDDLLKRVRKFVAVA
ncbi:MAG: metallophosphoesterase [Phycisphaerae bacterium]|nr:metallophosphoesterase [Phycisphaerae bacterium]